MPRADTVEVALDRSAAAAAGQWLVETYSPEPLSDEVNPERWCAEQRRIAEALGKQLAKAADRKGGATIRPRIQRTVAEWFATFSEPDGTWNFGKVPKDLTKLKLSPSLPGQACPAHIQAIARVFYSAVIRRLGRPDPTIAQIERQVAEHKRKEAHNQLDPNDMRDTQRQQRRAMQKIRETHGDVRRIRKLPT